MLWSVPGEVAKVDLEGQTQAWHLWLSGGLCGTQQLVCARSELRQCCVAGHSQLSHALVLIKLNIIGMGIVIIVTLPDDCLLVYCPQIMDIYQD